ncbi:MAG: copper amine oxidase N-terminal domain-containing protein, partial [Clostridiales bacterium]|nr:copper amine oxidase N-terminal domain-containing protein [Clostridiales bacterium]
RILCVCLSLLVIAILVASAGDPLVTKSWTDKYVEESFKKPQEKLSQLQNQIAALSARLGQGFRIIIFVGQKKAQVNNDPAELDSPPLLRDNRLLLPLRFIGQALHASFDWHNPSKTVTFRKGDKLVVMTVGKMNASVNGIAKPLPTPPYLSPEGRILIPARFLAETLGCKVDWDNKLKKAEIYL